MSRWYDMYQNMLMYSMCVYGMLRECTKTQSVFDMPIGHWRISLFTKQPIYTTKWSISIDFRQKKIVPVEQHVPVPIFIRVGNDTYESPLRPLPRNRERMADFVIDFVREMNQKMNTWYNDNINRLHIHYITRNMNLYHNLIHGILRYRTPSVIRRDMQTIDNIYYNITHTHNL